jgi:hypothetical protein
MRCPVNLATDLNRHRVVLATGTKVEFCCHESNKQLTITYSWSLGKPVTQELCVGLDRLACILRLCWVIDQRPVDHEDRVEIKYAVQGSSMGR